MKVFHASLGTTPTWFDAVRPIIGRKRDKDFETQLCRIGLGHIRERHPKVYLLTLLNITCQRLSLRSTSPFTMHPPKTFMPSRWSYRLNLTHFIRIPLLNHTSSSQIQKTLSQVASDPVSATVPRLAYRPLQRLNISVAALSLPTQQAMDRAIALLQHLGSQDWPTLFSKAQASPLNAPMSSTSGSPPLIVSALSKQTFPSLSCVRVPSHVLRAKYL